MTENGDTPPTDDDLPGDDVLDDDLLETEGDGPPPVDATPGAERAEAAITDAGEPAPAVDPDAADGTEDDANDDGEDDGDDGPPWWSVGGKVRAWMPYYPSTGGRGLGVAIGNAISSAIAKVILGCILLVTRLIPGTWRTWRALLRASYRGLYKTTDADYLGHISVGGEIKHVPLEYNHELERVETLEEDPDYWNMPSEADNTYRAIGNVPAVWASASSNELGSHVQAEVAEVLDLGGGQELFRSAEVEHVIQAGQGGQQALADGGLQRMQGYVSVRDPGRFEDELVDIGHDADARVVSMDKYYQTYPSVVAPEEMQLQEERGRLAERQQDYAKLALKFLLIAGAIIAVVELGPPLIEALFGGGGGGGSMIPLSLPTLPVIGGG